jgi:hypothetical protein
VAKKEFFYFALKFDDLVKSKKSRHSCESSPPQADRRRPCESREPEIYESGFLFSQETLDSRFRGNDENGAKRTFYEAIKFSQFFKRAKLLQISYTIKVRDGRKDFF